MSSLTEVSLSYNRLPGKKRKKTVSGMTCYVTNGTLLSTNYSAVLSSRVNCHIFTAHRVFACIDVQEAWLLLFINIL